MVTQLFSIDSRSVHGISGYDKYSASCGRRTGPRTWPREASKSAFIGASHSTSTIAILTMTSERIPNVVSALATCS